jgi:hypothetical protein
MARANARLRGEESYLAAPTRFLGHYVVGNLARQMGIEVELAPSPLTGVTARVALPESMLASVPAVTASAAEPTRATTAAAVPEPEPRAISAGPLVVDAVVIDPPPADLTVGPDQPRMSPAPPHWPEWPGGDAGGWGGAPVAEATRDSDLGAAPYAGPPAARSFGAGGTGYLSADGVPRADGAGGDRTRNGLRRRVPAARSGSTPTTTSTPGSETDSRAGVETGDARRSRLSELRAGMARRESERGGDPYDRDSEPFDASPYDDGPYIPYDAVPYEAIAAHPSEDDSDSERSTHAR